MHFRLQATIIFVWKYYFTKELSYKIYAKKQIIKETQQQQHVK